jgi:hypothetical protein
MYPDLFKEYLSSGLCYDAFLVGSHNRHLAKSINNQKNIVISPLGGWEAQHVVHADGFPWPIRSRKRGVQALFLSGHFSNSIGGVVLDILADILSKFWPVETFLHH